MTPTATSGFMAPRRRASTLKGSSEDSEELQDRLKCLSLGPDAGDGVTWLQGRVQAAYQIRQILLDNPRGGYPKDVFRRIGGFQVILDVLRDTLQRSEGQKATITDHHLLLEILQTTFGILAAAFQLHEGNRRYFRERVKGNGWSSLSTILSHRVHIESHGQDEEAQRLVSRIFGCLLACAVDDESVVELFSPRASRAVRSDNLTDTPSGDSKDVASSCSTATMARLNQDIASDEALTMTLGSSTSIIAGDALQVMFELWKSLLEIHAYGHIAMMVPRLLNYLTITSTSNLAALHRTRLLPAVLRSLTEPLPVPDASVHELRKLASRLLDLGVGNLDDAHFLYRLAKSSPTIAELLSISLRSCRVSSYVHFDLSHHGFASIELPSIRQSFPPVSNSNGYTLSMWFQMTQFDPNSHTTIFGAFDASQACFVLVYLEKDTHNLILQTSIKSSRPSVRFKSTSFREGCWYHIALVHRRPRPTSSSRASLFVNGEFVEQVKSQYPALPPKMKSVSKSGESSQSPVQAFFGTPQDLASRLGKNIVHTQWRLGSAQLFSEVLSDDLLAVYYRLGPRYTGNFQDCLGSFQTYQASAELNLRNESLHPGKEERSEIVLAIRSKAGDLLPESKILLNMSATNIYSDREVSPTHETQILQSLTKAAYRNFVNVTRGGRNALAVNGSYPAINQALLFSSGYGVLTGNPTFISSRQLDDAAWQVGGCAAVCLALVDATEDADGLYQSMQIFFSSIHNNWRNSEAIERENGFGILANLLTTKLKKFDMLHDSQDLDTPLDSKVSPTRPSMISLRLVLDFVGYRVDKPVESVINNPLAYRTLLVDLDIWRHSSLDVQKLYYEQFTTFAINSKYHQFNTKRLSRMRIVKKWLEALKHQAFTTTTFKYFLDTFKVMLGKNPSADTMRSLALFVTYAIHKPKENTSVMRRKSAKFGTNTPTRRKTISGATSRDTQSRDFGDANELGLLQVALGVLELYTEMLCQKHDVTDIKRFARTVTNKWLLFLLADSEVSVVALAAKILSRLLVVSGPIYMHKFVEKTGGITIMRHRLQRLWHIPAIWLACFAILFGRDIANINFGSTFDLYTLLEIFTGDGKTVIAHTEMLPVLTAMLKSGLLALNKAQPESHFPSSRDMDGTHTEPLNSTQEQHARQKSLTLSVTIPESTYQDPPNGSPSDGTAIMHIVTRFLADVHTRSQAFRDFAATSTYVQELFLILFPVIVSSDTVSSETELHSRDSSLTFKGEDVTMKPISAGSMNGAPVVRTSTPDSMRNPYASKPSKPQAPKRMSSYVLVTSDTTDSGLPTPKLQSIVASGSTRPVFNATNSIIEEILELALAVFCDQIFARKDFPGLGLFMRVPPGFQEHQAYFETYILRNALSQIGNSIKLDQKLLWEPRVLTNIARLAMHLAEAIYEGWFIDGADDTFDFLANILEYLQLPDVSTMKSVRLCSQIIANVRAILLRIVLLRLSELDESASSKRLIAFLDKLAYWQTVLLPAQESGDEFLRLFCYLLYARLDSHEVQVKSSTANLWRLLLVHKHDEISIILQQAGESESEGEALIRGFKNIIELDNETFLDWFDINRSALDKILFVPLSKNWSAFVANENRHTEENAKARIGKRRERLKIWAADEVKGDETIRRHETSSEHWRSNIYTAEHIKRQRAIQDDQDSKMFHHASWTKLHEDLCRPCGLLDHKKPCKWQLDQTEGRNRMRMRFIPDRQANENDYLPKRRQSQGPARHRSSVSSSSTPTKNAPPLPGKSPTPKIPSSIGDIVDSASVVEPPGIETNEEDGDDDFELVGDPRAEAEEYEDKNRKVMRSLQRGDQVENVYNTSRILGLEAVEGLLIVGKSHLYLLDYLFQRVDGEIVNVIQAPQDERDPYLQMISGRENAHRTGGPAKPNFETRSWRWDEVLSISKRRFLFRDVAIEIFFVDGRSYLLTTRDSNARNEVHQKLLNKASNPIDGASSMSKEDDWRLESLRSPDDEIPSLGSRFTNVFAQQASNSGTRRWLRGEISNFHYLMLVNTMAGRTFNDLTQYPVFPWVLADYTSEELNFSNPRTFRDLNKPMGCQTFARQADFQDRYHSFAEMGDENAPPFHYGTHYSSAMIVTSYLIRLQPFVQSYLLLQGGFFDHADRLFYSVEKAWNSASRENMTDVRELIPEFYYLPEIFTNMNGYDLGERQGAGGTIDNVALPPWAKGDPKVFVAKHREALESEYVTQNLHAWIDLVFGHKQRGEAALEATNVFHHLSYQGAKDLDTINDPVERLATIGIIHNFGQTPHQVFQRAHPAREVSGSKLKRMDYSAENLTRLPFPVLESHDRIASLQWSEKHDKLLPSGPLRLNIGPSYDKYMEWGFFDGSVRFYTVDSAKLIGLFEQVHIGQLSTAQFADSKTLITAGSDCTISVWTVISTSKSVDLQPRKTLFGHRTAITLLAISRSFSTLLSASSDGRVILWDLNRLDLVRVLAEGEYVECSCINDITGNIILCRGLEVSIWTLNGELILQQEINVDKEDTISSCAFFEGNGNEYLERQLIFTGHRRGIANAWSIAIRNGSFVLDHVKRMHHMDQAGFNVGASITAILPMAQVVYTGDDDGRVYEWDCIQRQ